MVKQLLSTLGIAKRGGFFGRKSRVPLLPALPFGGILPVAAYLAWKNRDKFRSLYNRVTHHDMAAQAA
jgi:uncharacterized membrane protein (UPF0136 family)